MITFGEFIRSMRKAKGLTLEKLANKIGTEKGYISSIENGKVNPPSADVVREMADALGVSRVELLLLAYVEKAPKEIQAILSNGVKAVLDRGQKALPKEASKAASKEAQKEAQKAVSKAV